MGVLGKYVKWCSKIKSDNSVMIIDFFLKLEEKSIIMTITSRYLCIIEAGLFRTPLFYAILAYNFLCDFIFYV